MPSFQISGARGGPTLGVPARLLALVGILATAALVLALGGSAAPTGGPLGVLPSGTPLDVQTCTELESPDRLNSSLADLYSGFSLGNVTAGPNGTPALGISSYPALASGLAALRSAWTVICESGQFAYAFVQANGSSGFFSGGDLAQDGHYVFFYGFIWQDECPSSVANSTFPCQATATWTVDLVTGAVFGPSWTNLYETPFGAPEPPRA